MTMYTCVCTAITRNAVSIMLIMIIFVHHSIFVWSMDCSYQEDSNISILEEDIITNHTCTNYITDVTTSTGGVYYCLEQQDCALCNLLFLTSSNYYTIWFPTTDVNYVALEINRQSNRMVGQIEITMFHCDYSQNIYQFAADVFFKFEGYQYEYKSVYIGNGRFTVDIPPQRNIIMRMYFPESESINDACFYVLDMELYTIKDEYSELLGSDNMEAVTCSSRLCDELFDGDYNTYWIGDMDRTTGTGNGLQFMNISLNEVKTISWARIYLNSHQCLQSPFSIRVNCSSEVMIVAEKDELSEGEYVSDSISFSMKDLSTDSLVIVFDCGGLLVKVIEVELYSTFYTSPEATTSISTDTSPFTETSEPAAVSTTARSTASATTSAILLTTLTADQFTTASASHRPHHTRRPTPSSRPDSNTTRTEHMTTLLTGLFSGTTTNNEETGTTSNNVLVTTIPSTQTSSSGIPVTNTTTTSTLSTSSTTDMTSAFTGIRTTGSTATSSGTVTFPNTSRTMNHSVTTPMSATPTTFHDSTTSSNIITSSSSTTPSVSSTVSHPSTILTPQNNVTTSPTVNLSSTNNISVTTTPHSITSNTATTTQPTIATTTININTITISTGIHNITTTIVDQPSSTVSSSLSSSLSSSATISPTQSSPSSTASSSTTITSPSTVQSSTQQPESTTQSTTQITSTIDVPTMSSTSSQSTITTAAFSTDTHQTLSYSTSTTISTTEQVSATHISSISSGTAFSTTTTPRFVSSTTPVTQQPATTVARPVLGIHETFFKTEENYTNKYSDKMSSEYAVKSSQYDGILVSAYLNVPTAGINGSFISLGEMVFTKGSIGTTYMVDFADRIPLNNDTRGALVKSITDTFREQNITVDPNSFLFKDKTPVAPPQPPPSTETVLLAGILGSVITLLIVAIAIAFIVIRICLKNQRERNRTTENQPPIHRNEINNNLMFQFPNNQFSANANTHSYPAFMSSSFRRPTRNSDQDENPEHPYGQSAPPPYQRQNSGDAPPLFEFPTPMAHYTGGGGPGSGRGSDRAYDSVSSLSGIAPHGRSRFNNSRQISRDESSTLAGYTPRHTQVPPMRPSQNIYDQHYYEHSPHRRPSNIQPVHNNTNNRSDLNRRDIYRENARRRSSQEERKNSSGNRPNVEQLSRYNQHERERNRDRTQQREHTTNWIMNDPNKAQSDPSRYGLNQAHVQNQRNYNSDPPEVHRNGTPPPSPNHRAVPPRHLRELFNEPEYDTINHTGTGPGAQEVMFRGADGNIQQRNINDGQGRLRLHRTISRESEQTERSHQSTSRVNDNEFDDDALTPYYMVDEPEPSGGIFGKLSKTLSIRRKADENKRLHRKEPNYMKENKNPTKKQSNA